MVEPQVEWLQVRPRRTKSRFPALLDILSTIEESPRSPDTTAASMSLHPAHSSNLLGGLGATMHSDLASRRWAAELEAKRQEWLGW